MDSKEFISQAILTESPYDEKTKERLFSCATETQFIFDKILINSIYLDHIKKYIFYGKNNTVLKNFVFNDDELLTTEEKEKLWEKIRLLHAIIGLQTEIAELIEAFNKEELDTVNLKEEVADMFWYQAILANELDFSFEELYEKVTAKLRARYPNKFTSYDAINRNLDVERKILEDNHKG